MQDCKESKTCWLVGPSTAWIWTKLHSRMLEIQDRFSTKNKWYFTLFVCSVLVSCFTRMFYCNFQHFGGIYVVPLLYFFFPLGIPFTLSWPWSTTLASYRHIDIWVYDLRTFFPFQLYLNVTYCVLEPRFLNILQSVNSLVRGLDFLIKCQKQCLERKQAQQELQLPSRKWFIDSFVETNLL